MKLGSIAHRPVVTIEAGATLRDAAALLRTAHVGALLVISETEGRQQAVGLLTDRDIAIEAVARDLQPSQVRVASVASRGLVCAHENADLVEGVAALAQAAVRRLLVTNDEGHVVGIVSSDDLLEALVAPLTGLAAAFRAGIEREQASRGAPPPASPRPVFLSFGTPGQPS